MTELIHRDEGYVIMGACFDVYSEKGCGFLEPVYHECMEIELRLREIPAISKPKLMLEYKGHPICQGYYPDFVCHDRIILELKAVAKLADEHRAQVINDLRASRFKLGILVNFGHYPRLEWERFANTAKQPDAPPRLLDD